MLKIITIATCLIPSCAFAAPLTEAQFEAKFGRSADAMVEQMNSAFERQMAVEDVVEDFEPTFAQDDDAGDHNAPNDEDFSDCVVYLSSVEGVPLRAAEQRCMSK